MRLNKKKADEQTYKMQMGRALLKGRTASKLTQAQVASHLGIARETYGLHERGQTPFPAHFRQPFFDLTGYDPLPSLVGEANTQRRRF